MANVVVKRNVSSFGDGMSGPFASANARALDASTKEYYEEYVEGTIVKVWYWNAAPVAAEAVPPLAVYGNGHSTIWELVEAHARIINRPIPEPSYFSEFLSFHGLTVASVPPAGEWRQIDYRYNSVFPNTYHGRDVRIGIDEFFGLERELASMGQAFWESIPEDLRQDVVYVVDGVVDAQQQLWVLELNSNPVVHPYVYCPMIQSWVDRVHRNAANLSGGEMNIAAETQ